MNDKQIDAEAWGRTELDKAVREILNTGIFQAARVEAGIVWMLPGAVLIGQVRENIDKSAFRWIITGPDVPLDHVQGNVAENARDALKHFCLKWQLGAEKVREASVNDPDTGDHYRAKADQLAKQAEDLYEIAEADQFWQK